MSASSYKICLIGNQSVGKTALILRYARGQFNEYEKSTIGANFVETTYTKDEKVLSIGLWDPAGQEKYRSIVGMYYRGSCGIVLVYDITNRLSFEEIRNWHEEVKKNEPKAACLLLGNKMDCEDKRVVSFEEGEQMARNFGMYFDEVSAKTGENVKEAFHKFYDSIKFGESNDEDGSTIKIEDDEDEEQKQKESSGCCN